MPKSLAGQGFMQDLPTRDDVGRLLPARKGHFRLESGHHGDTWLDLELLCLRPEPVRRLAAQIGARLRHLDIEAVCGPLVEGAFVALMVAPILGVRFTYSERLVNLKTDELYPVQYRLPRALRAEVRGKRVAIVNDVIYAGSAVRGTFADLKACDAEPVAIGALAVLGDWALNFAVEEGLTLQTVASLPNEFWTPSECPLCASGVPLVDVADSHARGYAG